jgi:AmmeMemoRadiSam system protein A
MLITDDDGRRLLEYARQTIAHALGGPPAARPEGAWLGRPAATFVTISRGGVLHGCIGSLVPRRPLLDDVAENALAAAFADPRSTPYRAEHLPEMDVEVTLLGPLERMDFEDEQDALRQVVPHVDGLVIRYGGLRGTFLPQVWDSLEDPADFLAELKVKAGLGPGFWAPGVELSRFRVQKWGGRRAVFDGGAAPRPPQSSAEAAPGGLS